MKENLMRHITEKSPYQDMTTGGIVLGGGNSVDVRTGEWRTVTPRFIPDKCTQCLLCFPV